jgi:mannose-6-phosphate isomerase
LTPRRLNADLKEKVWGDTSLAPWFPNQERKIGEVWFGSQERLPILVKFLFTSEKLSVQVHPDDTYGAAHENSPGKTEMWYILRAAPGARIAQGFREPVSEPRVRQAIATGEIEALLQWHAVKPGDCFFTPAGVVHAIGGGIALCEIQQQSDITYRLYDYNRQPPRELHIERALAVADLTPHTGPQPAPRPADGAGELVRCRYFTTELLHWSAPFDYQTDNHCAHLLIVLEGAGAFNGAPFRLGETWYAEAGTGRFKVEPQGTAKLLRTYVPPHG